MTLGERIKERRIALNLNQSALAKLAGVTQTQISKYELGLAEPVASNLLSIADALDVSIEWLVGRVNDFHDIAQKTIGDLTEHERQIIVMYRAKSEEKQNALFDILKVI